MARLLRRLYSALWWLLLPLALARLWWRGRREPGYRRHLGERLGVYRTNPTDSTAQTHATHRVDQADPTDQADQAARVGQQPMPTFWVHAVSVGETRAAEPLVEALLKAWPTHRILLTHMTPTGRATGAALFGRHGPRVVQCYLPYDTGTMMASLLRAYRPRICLLIETEVWPNLVAQCQRHAVPVALVNGRLSARSLARGMKFRALLGEAARGLACAGAQTPADAMRLQEFGVAPVTVTGSIKFDVVPPQAQLALGAAWRRQFGQRRVLLCASTREGEEEAILAAWKTIPVDALLVIVPRHPQRFDAVAELVAAHGMTLARRSVVCAASALASGSASASGSGSGSASGSARSSALASPSTSNAIAVSAPGSETASSDGPLSPSVQVLLGDSMGEMFAYLAAADVAFIGGSLLPLGGQNLIEACAVGTPVLIGPHTFNFAAVTEDAIEAGAALRVEDAAAMLASAQALLSDAAVRGAMAGAARAFAMQHRGATARTMEMLAPLLR